MIFCSACGTQFLSEAAFCGSCGSAVSGKAPGPTAQASPNPPPPPLTATAAATITATNSFDKKLHITLICAAGIAVLLIFTTFNIPLIGLATGVAFGLSARLFFSHKKNDFVGTKKIDWMLLAIFSTVALIVMMFALYAIQGFLLIFVAVRSLIMYFKMNSNDASPAP